WSEFAAGSLVLLIPGQPPGALAVELFVLAAVAGVALGWLSRPSRRAPEQPVASWVGTTVVPAAVVALAPVVAGSACSPSRSVGCTGCPRPSRWACSVGSPTPGCCWSRSCG
ncbi:MAG: hypothetical protein AVDCRST_MAG54-4648, partial [uncultured Actinomycetospora sp.]